ncbi:hypothetical protein EJ110_NYTH22696 [Nymphaea thermarum]|nr:hypothetical protein EJ110_NYTH22696 [Nymphaea thermarum]
MASETSAMSSTQMVSSPLEMNGLSPFDHKISMAKRYAHEGVVAGAKAAVVASIATATPTFACVRTLQWAKYNLNPTAQALVISTDLPISRNPLILHQVEHSHDAIKIAKSSITRDYTTIRVGISRDAPLDHLLPQPHRLPHIFLCFAPTIEHNVEALGVQREYILIAMK